MQPWAPSNARRCGSSRPAIPAIWQLGGGEDGNATDDETRVKVSITIHEPDDAPSRECRSRGSSVTCQRRCSNRSTVVPIKLYYALLPMLPPAPRSERSRELTGYESLWLKLMFPILEPLTEQVRQPQERKEYKTYALEASFRGR